MEHQARKAWIREAFVCADCGACFSNRDAYAMHVMLRAQNDSCVPGGSSRSDTERPDYHHHLTQDGLKKITTDSIVINLKSTTSPKPCKSPYPENLVIKKESVEEEEFQTNCGGLAATPPAGSKNTCTSRPASISSDQRKQLTAITSQPHHVFRHSPFLSSFSQHSVSHERKQHSKSLLKTWLCYKCNKIFDSCDTLAMHAMDCCHVSSSNDNNVSLRDTTDESLPATNGLSFAFGNHHDAANGSVTSSMFDSRNSLLLQNSLAQKLLKDISSSPLHAQLYLPYLSQTQYALLTSMQDVSAQQADERAGSTGNALSHSPSSSNNDTSHSHSSVETIKRILAAAQQLMRREQAGLGLFKDEPTLMMTPRDERIGNRISPAPATHATSSTPAIHNSCASPLTPTHKTIVLPAPTTQPSTSSGYNTIDKVFMSHLENKLSPRLELQEFTQSGGNSAMSSTSNVTHATDRSNISEREYVARLHGRVRRLSDVSSALDDRDYIMYAKRMKHNNLNISSEIQSNFPILDVKLARKTHLHDGLKENVASGTGSIHDELSNTNSDTDELLDYSIKSGKCNEQPVREAADTLLGLPHHAVDNVSTSKDDHAAVTTQEDEYNNDSIVRFVINQSNSAAICSHCKIIFIDRTLYHIHMGLHNLNNPWQCNLCGKVCQNCHDFTTHVLHLSNNR